MSRPTTAMIIFDGNLNVTLRMREPRAMRRALTEALESLDATPAEAADAMKQLAAIVREHGVGEDG